MIQPQLAHGARYAVAAGHTAATEAAARVLEGGGNAIDAALAGAGVLSVVLPYACGLGGDLFALVHDAKSRATLVLNASGRAPGRFAFSGDIPRTGAQSATVPGMPKGWMALAERFGTRPLAELLQPAVVLARDGFPAHRCQLENTTGRAKSLSRDAEASRLESFYETFEGPFSRDDLAAQDVLWQAPLSLTYQGLDVVTAPPNSWGLGVLLQLLALGEPDGEDAFVRAGIAARRLAHAAARDAVGDPAAAEDKARALLESWRRNGVSAPQLAVSGDESVGTDTSNIVVMDRAGNAVTPGTGVLLNNRMGGFSPDPASVNALGPRRRPANTLCPILVMRNGGPLAAIGTPGAPGQTGVLAQVIARLFGRGEALADAVAAPRWSVDMQGKFIAERAMDPARRDALGLKPMPDGWQTFGSVKIATRRHEVYAAVADQRRCAAAAAG
jgi:gamma-glutamyltranspeptidase/glutathione hydrolase